MKMAGEGALIEDLSSWGRDLTQHEIGNHGWFYSKGHLEGEHPAEVGLEAGAQGGLGRA